MNLKIQSILQLQRAVYNDKWKNLPIKYDILTLYAYNNILKR